MKSKKKNKCKLTMYLKRQLYIVYMHMQLYMSLLATMIANNAQQEKKNRRRKTKTNKI